jgi:hypothetical protein
LHKSGNFGLHVKKEDIDWEAYLKGRSDIGDIPPS